MPHFIFFDCETTGVEFGSRLIELGAIATDEAGQVLATFHCLCNPGMPIPADSTRTHNITDDMVGDVESADLALVCFSEWLQIYESPVMIAHNAPYDVGIMSYELQRAGLPMLDAVVFDTCAHARALKVTKDNKLSTLVEHYGIEVIGVAHRAMADVDACRQYFNLTRPDPIVVTPWQAPYQFTDKAEHLTEHLFDLPELVATASPLSFDYADAKGNPSTRTITPYGWALLSDGSVSFHGLDHSKGARRTFKADRILRRLVTVGATEVQS